MSSAPYVGDVNVLAELERIGLGWEPVGTDELKVRCPFHDDRTPSCSLNVKSKLFKCHSSGCGASGDVVTFLAGWLKVTRRVVVEDLSTRYGLDDQHVIGSDVVERYHGAVWINAVLVAELRKRGVSDAAIRARRIGVNKGRVTIPIYNENGTCVNVRRYLPGAPSRDKMKNTRGHGKVRLYPIEQLKYDRIVVCGGEVKAIVVADLLNPLGIGAVTTTGGEGYWENAFSLKLAGKDVSVCFDVDREGIDGAERVCAMVRRAAKSIRKLLLPLDVDKYPHGDVNDWVGQEGAKASDLTRLIEETEPWAPPRTEKLEQTEPVSLHLTQIVQSEHAGKRVTTRAVVAAMDTTPYLLPSEVSVSCDRSEHDLCAVCQIMAMEQEREGCRVSIPPEHPSVLSMVNAPAKEQRAAIMHAVGVPATCKQMTYRVLSYANGEDVRLTPQLEITNQSTGQMLQPALYVGRGLELNTCYRVVGRVHPHPKTQQAVAVLSEAEPVTDALSSYSPTDEQLDELMRLRPREWTSESIQEALDARYAELSERVTRILERDAMHALIDLAYHSVMLIPLNGQVVKGWVEVLVLGDTAQGKTETAMRLREHYGLGEKVECKNASVAGLLGGLQQMGSRWFVSWGAIPTHDRRLVILEELKGAHQEVIAKLTDMRSSGVAEIPKIERRRTHARTRIIALSNPRSDHPLNAYSFGIEAVKELVGGPEDIRRFDAVLVVRSSDVDVAKINREHRKADDSAPRMFTSGLCRSSVLWAWTRTPDQVLYDDETYAATARTAAAMCDEYDDSVPIVDRGSMRFKLARLATSLACLTFSTDEERERVIVRPCHVEWVQRFLDAHYSGEAIGYKRYTEDVRALFSLRDPDDVIKRIQGLPFPGDFVASILSQTDIELRDLMDWCGFDRLEAQELESFLRRKHSLVRYQRVLRKTPEFITLLRSAKIEDRPNYMKEEF